MLKNHSSDEQLQEKLVALEQRNQKFREMWQKLQSNMKSETPIDLDQGVSESIQSILQRVKDYQKSKIDQDQTLNQNQFGSMNQPEICFHCDAFLTNLNKATEKVSDLDKELDFKKLVKCYKTASFEKCEEINSKDDFLQSILKEIDYIDWTNQDENKSTIKKVSKLKNQNLLDSLDNKKSLNEIQNILDKFRNEPLSVNKSTSDLDPRTSSSTLMTLKNDQTKTSLSNEGNESKELLESKESETNNEEKATTEESFPESLENQSGVLENHSINIEFDSKLPKESVTASLSQNKSKNELKINTEDFTSLTFSLESKNNSCKESKTSEESLTEKIMDSEKEKSSIESLKEIISENETVMDSSDYLPEIVSLAKKMKLDIESDMLQNMTNPLSFLQSQLEHRNKIIQKERSKILTEMRLFCNKNLINTSYHDMESVPEVNKVLEKHIEQLKEEKQKLSKQFYSFNVSESNQQKESFRKRIQDEDSLLLDSILLDDMKKRVQLLNEVRSLITDRKVLDCVIKNEKSKSASKEVKYFTCRKRYINCLQLKNPVIKIDKEKFQNKPLVKKKK